jgi:hypothetical protein
LLTDADDEVDDEVDNDKGEDSTPRWDADNGRVKIRRLGNDAWAKGGAGEVKSSQVTNSHNTAAATKRRVITAVQIAKKASATLSEIEAP